MEATAEEDSKTAARVANSTEITEENRVSMAVPMQMLQVPEIEGFVMHWFADRPGRIPRAVQAGWQFVKPDEVKLNNFGFASDVIRDSGNTDLGERVSVHGSVGDNGQSERLYLMKIRKDWYDKDMMLREKATEQVVQGLRSGTIGMDKTQVEENKRRYGRRSNENLFTKKSRG